LSGSIVAEPILLTVSPHLLVDLTQLMQIEAANGGIVLNENVRLEAHF
jgi:hypothetical protein